MIKPPILHNERDRQAALDATGLVNSAPTERYDRYTRLVRRLFSVPTALISLVDNKRQWFKSRQGLEATETHRDISFCGHAIAQDGVFVVENPVSDVRFHDNPLVTEEPNIGFYAGCPINSKDGYNIGTLCIIDSQARDFSDDDRDALRDIAAMVSDEIATMRMATIDELTGISNRRAFKMLADQSLDAARRHNHQSSFIMIDLDGFKEINDQLGHAIGDEALQDFANLLLKVFRKSDILGRIGGDEFCVLLTETDDEHATITVDRFGLEIEHFNERSGRDYTLAFSSGIIQFDQQRHSEIDDLFKEADELMYQNKRAKVLSKNCLDNG